MATPATGMLQRPCSGFTWLELTSLGYMILYLFYAFTKQQDNKLFALLRETTIITCK